MSTLNERNAAARAHTLAVLEDVEFMLATREHPLNAARRVGYTPVSLARLLRREGRDDLANQFDVLEYTGKARVNA